MVSLCDHLVVQMLIVVFCSFIRRRFDWPSEAPDVQWVPDEAEIEASALARADQMHGTIKKSDMKWDGRSVLDKLAPQGALRGHHREGSDTSQRSSLGGIDP